MKPAPENTPAVLTGQCPSQGHNTQHGGINRIGIRTTDRSAADLALIFHMIFGWGIHRNCLSCFRNAIIVFTVHQFLTDVPVPATELYAEQK